MSNLSPRASAVVVSEIRRRIISGDLSEGASLSEARLMEQYGVSKPTIREAWRVLESEGLISVRRGALGGALVRTPSPAAAARQAGIFLQRRRTTLSDVHGARGLIESSVAHELARSGRRTDLRELRKHADVDAFAAEDLSACMAGSGFHRALVAASGSKTLMLYESLIAPIVDEHIGRYLAGGGDSSSLIEAANPRIGHPTLLRLIESGDAALAGDFWHEHLARLEARLTEAKFSTVTDVAGA